MKKIKKKIKITHLKIKKFYDKKKNKKTLKSKNINQNSLISKIIRFQINFNPEFKFKFNFSLENYIKGFFDKIENFISHYKTLRKDEKRRLKLEQIEKERKDKIEKQKQNQKEEELKIKLKEQSLKEDIKLVKERSKDIKLFLRKEQAILRIEQAEKQKQFLQKLKLD
ncbi:MAG: hypothetical protein EXR14_00645, partial [Pelagibacteraceae bacterium]|nr:hypothetical protein [Pelagibacteraceae bacterium]